MLLNLAVIDQQEVAIHLFLNSFCATLAKCSKLIRVVKKFKLYELRAKFRPCFRGSGAPKRMQ